MNDNVKNILGVVAYSTAVGAATVVGEHFVVKPIVKFVKAKLGKKETEQENNDNSTEEK